MTRSTIPKPAAAAIAPVVETPEPPAETGQSARRLWSEVVGRFELDEHELALLTEAVRTIDLLDRLASVVDADGPMVTSARGERVIHPAAIEARQQRVVLTRLVASLRLPEDSDVDIRPQRRGSARGAYAIRGVR